ncbi:hypothetical protein NPIL_126771 [Nephila pilipes]|uniref:Uncharacterized protein n=1 Tax=Nephila pilipes TaxID=299642 RepID=A0A8X6QS36_NEPPI|nr:hypothetical protein NPIL_126771 [Nephila pilipes]
MALYSQLSKLKITPLIQLFLLTSTFLTFHQAILASFQFILSSLIPRKKREKKGTATHERYGIGLNFRSSKGIPKLKNKKKNKISHHNTTTSTIHFLSLDLTGGLYRYHKNAPAGIKIPAPLLNPGIECNTLTMRHGVNMFSISHLKPN